MWLLLLIAFSLIPSVDHVSPTSRRGKKRPNKSNDAAETSSPESNDDGSEEEDGSDEEEGDENNWDEEKLMGEMTRRTRLAMNNAPIKEKVHVVASSSIKSTSSKEATAAPLSSPTPGKKERKWCPRKRSRQEIRNQRKNSCNLLLRHYVCIVLRQLYHSKK